MTTDSPTPVQDLLNWRAASRRTLLRWPGWIGLAMLIVGAFNHILAMACLGGCVFFATLPIWYVTTQRIVQDRPRPSVPVQALAWIACFLLALILSPTFTLDSRQFDDTHDTTTTWIKRSLVDSIKEPRYSQDELAWGQSNYDVRFVPASVVCPRYSTRLYPLFGVERETDWLNMLARSVDDWQAANVRPPKDILQRFLDQCKTGADAMLKAGLTKESALMHGDVDLFFARAEREHTSPSRAEVVLEDAQIPPDILKKVEALIASDPDYGFRFVSFNASVDLSTIGAKATVPGEPDVVRRLNPLAIAAALGRDKDVEYFKRE
ncbi:hypothetical protein WL35_21440 [Burkholderia ubonensis]|uniref:hypothetical protein n=1 Tax=Burkholderia ubonensis TaxID=101571 RepID=UPI000754B013|nr:hypothetical protein [Burkholderia ubonensis]KWB39647.1 hypothetical protein WL35_21440 [Burkholderia ubonensis]KWC52002.1 hypothetical protein WL52_05310 [Burkholderia ubonensis]